MNKIILDRSEFIELIINEDSICNINKDYNIKNIKIELQDNVKFIINHYNEIIDNELNIEITQKNNTEFKYIHSFINNSNYKLNININMIGNKSKNIIDIHGITDNGNTNIIVNGKVEEKTKDNELDEKIKLLNIHNGKSYIEPNMYINTKNVLANHSASITEIDKDYLFYLNSKGIDNNEAEQLIINGFINNSAK